MKKYSAFRYLFLTICCAFLTPMSSALAVEKLHLQGTAIRGHKELPKQLYIVPWKSAEPLILSTPPYQSILQKPLQALERSTFKRQVKYYNELYPAPVAAAKTTEQ